MIKTATIENDESVTCPKCSSSRVRDLRRVPVLMGVWFGCLAAIAVLLIVKSAIPDAQVWLVLSSCLPAAALAGWILSVMSLDDAQHSTSAEPVTISGLPAMSHDDLIKKAKEHAAIFERADSFRVRTDELPRVRVREAAIVYFDSDQREDRIEVFLDRQSGDFITATYIPPKSKQDSGN